MLPHLVRMFERCTGHRFRRVDGEHYIFKTDPGTEVAYTREQLEEEIELWSTLLR
jgi:hypothetical protein